MVPRPCWHTLLQGIFPPIVVLPSASLRTIRAISAKSKERIMDLCLSNSDVRTAKNRTREDRMEMFKLVEG